MHIYRHKNQLLTALLEQVSSQPSRPLLIGIDGRSGSGKTSLAAELASQLRARGSATEIFHLEDLYLGWEGLAQAVETWAELSASLKENKRGSYYSWDWQQQGKTGPHELKLPSQGLLICEGVGACLGRVDLSCWLELPGPIRKKRALERDGKIFADHWQIWAAQEESLLKTHHKQYAQITNILRLHH